MATLLRDVVRTALASCGSTPVRDLKRAPKAHSHVSLADNSATVQLIPRSRHASSGADAGGLGPSFGAIVTRASLLTAGCDGWRWVALPAVVRSRRYVASAPHDSAGCPAVLCAVQIGRRRCRRGDLLNCGLGLPVVSPVLGFNPIGRVPGLRSG